MLNALKRPEDRMTTDFSTAPRTSGYNWTTGARHRGKVSSRLTHRNSDTPDISGMEIANASQIGDFTVTAPPSGLSSFPEGEILLSFAGEAAYATFDFTSQYGRYIVDDFSGTFGSTERPPLPEPATIALLGLGLAGIGLSRRRKV